MKGFLSLIVVVGLGIFVVINYVGYQKTGSLPVRDWIANAPSTIKHSVKNVTGDDTSTKTTVKISKWTDAKGVVHYENRPVDGAQTLEVNPDDNVLPPAPVVAIPEEKAASKSKTMNEEMEELRKAKQAQMESIINN